MQIDPTTPTRILWDGAGKPAPSKSPSRPGSDPCYWCGLPCDGGGVRAQDVCGKMFSDHESAEIPWSKSVCVPCAWVMEGKGGNTLRSWSVVYREDKTMPPSNSAVHPRFLAPHAWIGSKDDLSPVVDVLLDPPEGRWFCSVASSGKIHTLPHTRLNFGSGRWSVRFERLHVVSTTEAFRRVNLLTSLLLKLGFGKNDIVTLNPHPSKLAKYGVKEWRQFATELAPEKNSALLRLVVFLQPKENFGVVNRTR
jgi:hypothetical protein